MNSVEVFINIINPCSSYNILVVRSLCMETGNQTQLLLRLGSCYNHFCCNFIQLVCLEVTTASGSARPSVLFIIFTVTHLELGLIVNFSHLVHHARVDVIHMVLQVDDVRDRHYVKALLLGDPLHSLGKSFAIDCQTLILWAYVPFDREELTSIE